MAFVEINPRYQQWLDQLGLVAPADFIDLNGLICSGHRDRHVRRLTLGQGPTARPVYLKREHRVRSRDRFANALAGFGFTARSFREFALLQQLEETGIGCPEAIATGEDATGRAFLLVRELEGAVEIRRFLETLRDATAFDRRSAATQLGKALAHIHAAGFDHPDLFAKHVLVRGSTANPASFAFLDWQRSRRRSNVDWRIRIRDLAALDASLADDLASSRERLRCLFTYLRSLASGGVNPRRTAGINPASRKLLARAARDIRHRAQSLLRKRRVRELRQPLQSKDQNLLWLDDEAVCVTPEFQDQIASARRGSTAQLVCRRAFRPFAWLWAKLRGTDLVAPEIEHAATLFRLQRHGIVTPRLLAVGQRKSALAQLSSFLLVEPIASALPLSAWLRPAHDLTDRIETIQSVANVMRGIHAAGCYFRKKGFSADILGVCGHRNLELTVALMRVEGLQQLRRPNKRAVLRDLKAMVLALRPICSRSEQLRFLLAYAEENQSNAATAKLDSPCPANQTRYA